MLSIKQKSLSLILLFILLSFTSHAAEDKAEQLKMSTHSGFECEMCHSGEISKNEQMPQVVCANCHEDIYKKYTKSIHGKLRAEGIEEAATCHNCHGEHNILPMGSAASKVHKQKVPFTCGQCHSSVLKEYSQSVHGVAVAKGLPDSPGCPDCHGEHSILPHTDKLSRVYSTNIAETTCPQCHANERIITKYNIPGGKVDSFKDTYHGMAGKIGDVKVANCASCHGVHNILASSNPKSSINSSNLAATCGKCHPNATENFVKGSVHGYLNKEISGKVIRYVKWIYVILIILVIGGFLFHNTLDYIKKLRALYQKRRFEPFYTRLNLNERIQHMILMTSFFILVITGFALKFGWQLPFVGGEINTFLRSTLHRICGVLMTGVLLYNIVYLLVTKRGRKILVDFLPRLWDIKQAVQYVMYLLGIRSEKPRFRRFTYWEKMEYWAVVWGGIIMGGTGFLLWFENWSLTFIPMWGIDVITLVHYLEAILATLAIIFGHLYFVILNPDVAPMSFTWLMGRIPKEYALDEHPLEYESREEEREIDPKKE